MDSTQLEQSQLGRDDRIFLLGDGLEKLDRLVTPSGGHVNPGEHDAGGIAEGVPGA